MGKSKKEYSQKYRDNITDSYVKTIINIEKQISAANVTNKMIVEKRKSIQEYRIKKRKLKEGWKKCCICKKWKKVKEFPKNKENNKETIKSYCIKCNREKAKKYYHKNKMKKKYKIKIKEWNNKYRTENKDRFRQIITKWQNKNKKQIKEYKKKNNKKRVTNLTDNYIKICIASSGITTDEITNNMVALKRARMKINRLLKGIRNETNSK
jgi:hypothetical protein